MVLLRLLATFAAMSLFGTSANAAVTMVECKVKYKAAHSRTRWVIALQVWAFGWDPLRAEH